MYTNIGGLFLIVFFAWAGGTLFASIATYAGGFGFFTVIPLTVIGAIVGLYVCWRIFGNTTRD